MNSCCWNCSKLRPGTLARYTLAHVPSQCLICMFKCLIATRFSSQCELYHWVDLLDRFDGILCDAGQTVENMSWLLVCDRPENGQLKALLLAVLNFTALLIEYSFSRHLYSSIEVPQSLTNKICFFQPEQVHHELILRVCFFLSVSVALDHPSSIM